MNMEATNASQPPSPASISAQAAVIKLISSKTTEVSSALQVELVDFIKKAIGSAAQYRVSNHK